MTYKEYVNKHGRLEVVMQLSLLLDKNFPFTHQLPSIQPFRSGFPTVMRYCIPGAKKMEAPPPLWVN